MDIYWRISTGGDLASFRRPDRRNRGDWDLLGPGSISPGLRDGAPDGYRYIDHMAEVARAAELAGFYGGLLPSFPHTDDPWVASAALARATSTFRFMVAFQPGFLHPVQAARMSASLQRATGGRLIYNIITGGGGPPQLWWGDRVDHDDRYTRTSEFLEVLKGVWHQAPYNSQGRFFQVEGAGLPPELASQPFPEIYFSGSSPAAIDAAGRHADYYLSWLEPYDALAKKFDQVRAHTERLGRRPKFAVRIDVMARHTPEAAWAEIRKGWAHVGQAELDRGLDRNGDSVGAMRASRFVSSAARRVEDFEVEPNVWGGFRVLRGGPAFGLVGSYEQVAERLDQLIDLGADAFILASNPHLEEAYRVGEEVLPLLRGGRGRAASPATQLAPVGA